MRSFPILAAAALLLLVGCHHVEPYGPVPTKQQLAWQDMDMYAFIHYSLNTYTDQEWGFGNEDPALFNPSDLDCRQWARTAKAAGFKGIIITGKHHDGFCLWPNPVSKHTVRESSWRGGRGDVLKELSEACAEEGIKFGIYISPWDRHDPSYGTEAYNEVFRQTLESALSGYGPVFEQWFDGACGEGPNGKRQVYDWELFHSEVFKWQPQAVVFSNIGPGCRWVGNERGEAGRTSWSTFSPDLHGALHEELPGDYESYLTQGDAGGEAWIPSETDVSIRPGWFWKESENSQVKSVKQLLDIYYKSVGRNSLLLLNVPPDTRGRIHEIDSVRLMEFRQALDNIFADNLALEQRREGNIWTVKVRPGKPFNRVVLQEDIAKGQRISAFTVEVETADGWAPLAQETTVGRKRILLVPQTSCETLRVRVTDALAKPLLKDIGLYYDYIYTNK